MRLELSAGPPQPDGKVPIRLIVLNDSYDPVSFDRRLLYGPQPDGGDPPLLSTEPSTRRSADNVVVLNPWCLYGRERSFQFDAGQVTFHGYLLRKGAKRVTPQGPDDPDRLLVAADPLVVDFGAPPPAG